MQHALVEYLVNAAWQVPLILAGALVVARLGGLSARGRNLAWLGFLAMAVIAPALPAYHPMTDYGPPLQLSAASGTALSALPTSPAVASLDRATPLRLLRLEMRPSSAALIRLAFVTAAAIGMARLALGALNARRLAHKSAEAALSSPVMASLRAFGQAHDARVPPVRTCPGLSCPVVVGAFSPMVLIPEGFTALAEGDQQAALLHEFAHVVRRDYAVNLISELAALPLGWHPAIYPLKAGIRRSRELACDSMAAACMSSQKVYARRLLSLARSMSAPTMTPAPALMGLFGKSDLEDRMRHLLASRGSESNGLRAARLGGATVVTVLALAPAVLFRVTPALAAAPAAPAPVPPLAALAAPPAVPALPAIPVSETASPRMPHRAACPPRQRTEHASAATPAAGVQVAQEMTGRQFRGVLISDDGHSIVAEDGRNIDGDTGSDAEQVARDVRNAQRQADQASRHAQEQAMEAARRAQEQAERATRHAQEQAAEAARSGQEQAMAAARQANSAEFKQRMADIAARQSQLAAEASDRAKQRIDATMALNDARIKEAMARAQAQIDAAVERQNRTINEQVHRQVERSLRESTEHSND